MFHAFCSAIGISQATLAQWIGISRFALGRLKGNETGKNSLLPDLFIRQWMQLQNENILPPAPEPSFHSLQCQIKQLELEQQRNAKLKAIEKREATLSQLTLRLAWLEKSAGCQRFRNFRESLYASRMLSRTAEKN